MGHVQDSPVSTNMISNAYMIYHMKVQIVSYNLDQKKIKNPKFIFCLILDEWTPERL